MYIQKQIPSLELVQKFIASSAVEKRWKIMINLSTGDQRSGTTLAVEKSNSIETFEAWLIKHRQHFCLY